MCACVKIVSLLRTKRTRTISVTCARAVRVPNELSELTYLIANVVLCSLVQSTNEIWGESHSLEVIFFSRVTRVLAVAANYGVLVCFQLSNKNRESKMNMTCG